MLNQGVKDKHVIEYRDKIIKYISTHFFFTNKILLNLINACLT